MTNLRPIFRLFTLGFVSAFMLVLDIPAVAANQVKPVYVGLPEITTALDHEYQIIVQVTLRVSGSLAEDRVRANAVKLRHALVLHLSDIDPQDLNDGGFLDELASSYAVAANAELRTKRAVKAVLFQKLVVQAK